MCQAVTVSLRHWVIVSLGCLLACSHTSADDYARQACAHLKEIPTALPLAASAAKRSPRWQALYDDLTAERNATTLLNPASPNDPAKVEVARSALAAYDECGKARAK